MKTVAQYELERYSVDDQVLSIYREHLVGESHRRIKPGSVLISDGLTKDESSPSSFQWRLS